MKYLIVGLGNIGAEYVDTRHNIGFQVLDAFAEAAGFAFKPDRYASVAEHKFKGRILKLIKPSTYMNLSGKAVNYWIQKEKIPRERLLIIVDDLALPFGTIRLKSKGGDAGHNGLIDIAKVLGNQSYNRMRFGIGSDFSEGKQVNYVLGKWSPEEKKLLPEQIENMIKAIKSFTTIGMARTMNSFNKKPSN